jgi:hypothetical protein
VPSPRRRTVPFTLYLGLFYRQKILQERTVIMTF